MKRIVIFLAVAAWAMAPETGMFRPNDAQAHYERAIQLTESIAATVPGLARAGEPLIENARQALLTMKSGAPVDSTLQYDLIANIRAYLELAEAMPKPHPFPAEARRQFNELRESVERAGSHFRGLLASKEEQLRAPDRDNLARYAEANARLSPPQSGKHRVVFLGDSITDAWRLNEYFPDQDFVNRGISGQITGQMLGRMMADVLAHKPDVMVVLAGTNDIARGVKLEAIQNNLAMIGELAHARKIKPIFASLLPVHDYNADKNPSFRQTRRRPPETILALNKWLEDHCKQKGYLYLDYFTASVDEKGFLKQDLSGDGLHPNATGYRVMAPLAQAAIAKALPGPPAPPEPVKKKRGLFGGLTGK